MLLFVIVKASHRQLVKSQISLVSTPGVVLSFRGRPSEVKNLRQVGAPQGGPGVSPKILLMVKSNILRY